MKGSPMHKGTSSHKSALKANMKDLALNSQARRDEYDRRGWAHDATSSVAPEPKAVKPAEGKSGTSKGSVTHKEPVHSIKDGKIKQSGKYSSTIHPAKTKAVKPVEGKSKARKADPASESETQKNFKGYQGHLDAVKASKSSNISDVHAKAAAAGAKRETERRASKKRSKTTTWGKDVGSNTSRDGSDYSAKSTDTVKRRSGGTKTTERGLSDGLHHQGKKTKKTVTSSKGKVKKVVSYDEKTGKKTKVKYNKKGEVKGKKAKNARAATAKAVDAKLSKRVSLR